MRIVPRGEWGARHDDGSGDRKLPATEAWLHHSVTKHLEQSATPAQEAAAMRDVEAIGESRYQQGISYTFGVFPSGRVYQGHSVHRVGTHTGGRNTVGIGICLIGDYSKHAPTAALIAAVADLLAHLKATGALTTGQLRGGHRDVKRLTGDSILTECPGNHAYARIPDINRLALHPEQGGFLMALTDAEQKDLLAHVLFIRGTVDSLNQYLNLGGHGDEVLRSTYNKAAQAGSIAAETRNLVTEQHTTLVAALTAALIEALGHIPVEHAVIDQAVRNAVSTLTIVLPETEPDTY